MTSRVCRGPSKAHEVEERLAQGRPALPRTLFQDLLDEPETGGVGFARGSGRICGVVCFSPLLAAPMLSDYLGGTVVIRLRLAPTPRPRSPVLLAALQTAGELSGRRPRFGREPFVTSSTSATGDVDMWAHHSRVSSLRPQGKLLTHGDAGAFPQRAHSLRVSPHAPLVHRSIHNRC